MQHGAKPISLPADVIERTSCQRCMHVEVKMAFSGQRRASRGREWRLMVESRTHHMPHPADLGSLPELAAQSHPDMALLSDRPWFALRRPVNTVGDLAGAVTTYADRLWAAGIRPGDTVAVVKTNHFDILAIACAAVRIGAVPALLSVKMEAAELLACLELLQRPT